MDDNVARQLSARVRVLCWVMTQPINHETRARAILSTWGSRCNRLLFMSTAEDPVLNTIVLPLAGAESRDQLWNKTSAAYRYVYEHHRDEYDWVLRADDDTYVIVENLRYLLSGHSPDQAVYFGCKFRLSSGVVYMSGGAGIVASRQAIRLLVERGLVAGECTDGSGGVDDVALGELDVIKSRCIEAIRFTNVGQEYASSY